MSIELLPRKTTTTAASCDSVVELVDGKYIALLNASPETDLPITVTADGTGRTKQDDLNPVNNGNFKFVTEDGLTLAAIEFHSSDLGKLIHAEFSYKDIIPYYHFWNQKAKGTEFYIKQINCFGTLNEKPTIVFNSEIYQGHTTNAYHKIKKQSDNSEVTLSNITLDADGKTIIINDTLPAGNYYYEPSLNLMGTNGKKLGEYLSIAPKYMFSVVSAPNAPSVVLVARDTIKLTSASIDSEDGTITTYRAFKNGVDTGIDVTLSVNGTYQFSGALLSDVFTLKGKDSSSLLSPSSNNVPLAPTGTATKDSENPFFAASGAYDFIEAPSYFYSPLRNKHYVVCYARTTATAKFDAILMWTCPGNSDPEVKANWSGPYKVIGATTGQWDDVCSYPCINEDSDGTIIIDYVGYYSGAGKIGHASCASGADETLQSNWTKYAGNPTISGSGNNVDWDEDSVYQPSRFKDGSMWVIVYRGRKNSGSGNQDNIGIATSTSRFGTWSKSVNNPIFSYNAGVTWRNSSITPLAGCMFKQGSEYYIGLTGFSTTANLGGIGFIKSSALDSGYTEIDNNPKISVGGAGTFDQNQVTYGGAGISKDGTKYLVFYTGRNASNTAQLGLATIPRT